ncbi:MAG: GTP-binding protein [Rhodospirillales bacterium]
MRLKLYRALTVPEAMAMVRAELGAEALILGTRRVADGVEITAALEPRHFAALAPDGRGHAAALVYHAVPDRLRGALSFGDFATALAGALPFGTLPLGVAPLLLTGPPGAGKTLTAVRLATRMVLKGQKPMVIAADGNKAGATEQLLAFTRLLGLPMTVAGNPVTLSRALAQRRDGAPVLIDAPGSDPCDPTQSDNLRALVAAAGARVAVVLPAGLDPAEAADTASAYADAGAEFLVATRLDVARRLGGIVAAAETARLILTEAGIGPGAADGLVPMTPEFLAARLLRTGKPRHAA